MAQLKPLGEQQNGKLNAREQRSANMREEERTTRFLQAQIRAKAVNEHFATAVIRKYSIRPETGA